MYYPNSSLFSKPIAGFPNLLTQTARYILSCWLILYLGTGALAQSGQARITEEVRTLTTYPFDDPTRTPILTENPKIYPYFTYEGYSHEGVPREWKVVKLENDYVEVYVLPEVGGKVWGAIEKSTGHEFIYRNEVMKFRNIAMRGPWTSGGIEFNFGLIGHTPATATPVDYLLRENEDGSVSCIVGTIDLPSRTHWRVEVRLPKDKAYFETRALWYNPTPLHQSYYNWMTGAAAARDDLEFFCPGDQYLGHPGDAHPWPVEDGRKISEYSQNAFGGSKSYHVVGEYNDFFGGYFHDDNFGFGHWARYDDMPGQKLWLWALSRSGGIWEDLLTDTDGQYIEFQAGRLFNQYSPSNQRNPITQAVFPPLSSDYWEEQWFPVKETGGLSAVSPQAVLHVREENGRLHIALNALAAGSGELQVTAGGKTIHSGQVALQPMEVFTTEVALGDARDYEVIVPAMGLHYYADPERHLIDRPFETPAVAPQSEARQLYDAGVELLEYRDYDAAMEKFRACLVQDAAHRGALTGLAELYFRRGQYEQAVEHARRALQFDTYDPAANFVAGIAYRAQGDFINALETLGWAARSMAFRSAAYAEMAATHLQQEHLDDALHYARRSLDFNRFNIRAHQVIAIAARRSGRGVQAEAARQALLEIDPLHHFAFAEKFLAGEGAAARAELTGRVRNEFPYQTYLELAIDYAGWGCKDDAARILELSPPHALVDLWLAYLHRTGTPGAAWQDHLGRALNRSADFVFPYRPETLKVLQWAAGEQDHWKLEYYLGLNYWGLGRREEAAYFLQSAGDRPDYAPFYAARADLLHQLSGRDPAGDLQRAMQQDPREWRFAHRLIRHYLSEGATEPALQQAEKAAAAFPDNYSIGMDHGAALLATEQYGRAIETLSNLQVLPFEGASEGRRLYERAHLGRAMEQLEAGEFSDAIQTLTASKQWPEELGVGKPYDVDERRQDYLLSIAYQRLGQPQKAEQFRKAVAEYTKQHADSPGTDHLLGLLSMPAADAEKLIEQWKNHGLEERTAIRWAIARYRQDRQALATLEMDPAYRSLFQGMDFALLEEAVQWKP